MSKPMRLTAPATRLHVGVLDGEAGAQHVVVDVVDLASRQVRGAELIDIHLDAALLDDAVALGLHVLPPQLVRHPGAAPSDHANAQPPLGLSLLQAQVGDLLGRRLGQREHVVLLRVDPDSFVGGYHRIPPAGSSVRSSSDARGGREAMRTTARATSSGLSIRVRSGPPRMSSHRGVSTAPGATTPTRTPSPRISSASTRLKAAMAALVAEYRAARGRRGRAAG